MPLMTVDRYGTDELRREDQSGPVSRREAGEVIINKEMRAEVARKQVALFDARPTVAIPQTQSVCQQFQRLFRDRVAATRRRTWGYGRSRSKAEGGERDVDADAREDRAVVVGSVFTLPNHIESWRLFLASPPA